MLRLLLALVAAMGMPVWAMAQAVDFKSQVKPILEAKCVACHGGEKQKAGLRLDRRQDALSGGDSGPVIVPGKSAESELWKRVSSRVKSERMPPSGDPLSSEQQQIIKHWIDGGAVWPDDGTKAVDRRDWWSFRPVVRPPVPVVPGVANPIDAFIRTTLTKKGLSPSTEADRRTLLRRVYFDLIGLPPSPEEIDAFITDPDPMAYERRVDRLLADPRYGERWARHWLDVVHYGDTHGYDKDQPRPTAWPYRDYVIRALNADKPYGRFIQEQLAGDVLFPRERDGVVATGFIAAGPWDLIGHAEVPESKTDGKIARLLDRDDMVTSTFNTFMSLTVQCARCHNHKFDPITQVDYYRLQAVFAALDRADRVYDADPTVAAQRVHLEHRRRELMETQKQVEAAVAAKGGAPLADLEKRLAAATRPDPARAAAFGYHSAIEPADDRLKWVQIDLGKSQVIQSLVFVACHDTFAGIGAGFGFPRRFKIEIAEDPDFARDVHVVLDRTAEDQANPGVTPQRVTVNGERARYVRFTATRLALRQNDYIFALADLQVFDASGRNVARDRLVTAKDSIEAPPRWRKANLVDGVYYGESNTDEVSHLRQQRDDLLAKVLDDTTRRQRETLTKDLAEVQRSLARLPPPERVYAGTIHHGSGAFTGTGPTGGKPRRIHVLTRGDVNSPGVEVAPGTVPLAPGDVSVFPLPPDHTEGQRRVALASWITDQRNPLTWRSIVNRVWLYHFGRGLVDSPNDFGHMGQLPSHPELLDWLASEFRDGEQSLKALHRLMVTSAAYRQSSAHQAEYARVDSGNVYMWRMNRRKLEAEAIRDTVLQISGKLSTTMGGPAFQDFIIEKPEHSPHYQYHLHDPEKVSTHRRSVYRFVVRSQPQPFLTTLDCADPSMSVEKRNETLTALQALALLNNRFMLAGARFLAARVALEPGSEHQKIQRAMRLALGRDPTPVERDALTAHASRHGLPSACRIILNLSEFAFTD